MDVPPSPNQVLNFPSHDSSSSGEFDVKFEEDPQEEPEEEPEEDPQEEPEEESEEDPEEEIEVDAEEDASPAATSLAGSPITPPPLFEYSFDTEAVGPSKRQAEMDANSSEICKVKRRMTDFNRELGHEVQFTAGVEGRLTKLEDKDQEKMDKIENIKSVWRCSRQTMLWLGWGVMDARPDDDVDGSAAFRESQPPKPRGPPYGSQIMPPMMLKRKVWINKNHKKTVKNGQARTRESEEYKSRKQSQESQASVKSSQSMRLECKSKVRYSRSRANDSRVSTDAPLSNSSPSNNSFDMQQIAASLEDKMTIKMNQMMNQMKALVVTTPAPVKAVEEVCVTCGSNHHFNLCPLTRGGNDFPVFHDNIQQFQQTAAVDLYEEKLTLRVGKDELVYYADKSEKNKEKNFVHAISIIDFSKDDPFSGSTTNTLPPSSSPMKTSDNLEKFADELAPLDSLPPGNDDSTFKKDFHEVNFQIYSNPLFEFDDSFKSSNVNPLFEENDKDVEIKSSSSSTLTSPEVSELEAYLEKDSIPPGIDLTLPPTFEVSSSNPTSPTLTGEKVCSWKTPMFFSLVRFVWKMMTRIAIRKKIICLLATYLHKKPKPLSQEVEEILDQEDAVSSDVPTHTIVMPIRITFDNLIDFNDHFSKPKDLKKELTVSFDSSESSILPHPLLDSDSPFTAELSASVTLNSLGNEDKVFKPGILVYHAIHDKNLVTLEKNLKDSFTFIIWTFLPFFTYTKESPLIFSFRSENFVFDPGIVTFHNPVAFS
ncbi:hypothetical protein Tco_0692017, partial [Tanacetum coccineum]